MSNSVWESLLWQLALKRLNHTEKRSQGLSASSPQVSWRYSSCTEQLSPFSEQCQFTSVNIHVANISTYNALQDEWTNTTQCDACHINDIVMKPHVSLQNQMRETEQLTERTFLTHWGSLGSRLTAKIQNVKSSNETNIPKWTLCPSFKI
jgi:hypothetical protein